MPIFRRILNFDITKSSQLCDLTDIVDVPALSLHYIMNRCTVFQHSFDEALSFILLIIVPTLMIAVKLVLGRHATPVVRIADDVFNSSECVHMAIVPSQGFAVPTHFYPAQNLLMHDIEGSCREDIR